MKESSLGFTRLRMTAPFMWCGGTLQTFLPAIKATWLSSVALGKEKKKCSPLRKESSCVLYAWREIKTGVPRWRTVELLCLLRDHRQWQGPAVTLLATGSSGNRAGPSVRPLAAREKSLSPSTWAQSKLSLAVSEVVPAS